jgi:hypothetical protein
MSLTTDGFALGGAFAIAIGSAVQARQAYTEFNEKTPVGESLRTLLVFAMIPLSLHGIPVFLTVTPAELTPGQVAVLPPGHAAVLAAGKATALTIDQEAALAEGRPIHLTDGQIAAMTAEQVKDMKRWLRWFLGWLCILIGALAVLVGAALMLTTDL